MTNEEFEKTRDFILEQQAQFASGMQRLRASQTRTERVVAQSERIVARFANGTPEGFKDVKAKINALIDSQMRTEDDLRNLLAALDRYFSRRRNRN